jgi:raffinose/stachyose/melibiose transport system substrate-binding protein
MHYIEAVEFQVLTEAGGAPAELAANWDFMKLPAPATVPGDEGALTGAPDGLVSPASAPRHRHPFLKFLPASGAQP